MAVLRSVWTGRTGDTRVVRQPKAVKNPSRISETHEATAREEAMKGVVFLGDRKLELREFADRKSTRLNSSHVAISYAVFCLIKDDRHDAYESETLRNLAHAA